MHSNFFLNYDIEINLGTSYDMLTKVWFATVDGRFGGNIVFSSVLLVGNQHCKNHGATSNSGLFAVDLLVSIEDKQLHIIKN